MFSFTNQTMQLYMGSHLIRAKSAYTLNMPPTGMREEGGGGEKTGDILVAIFGAINALLWS